MESMDQDANGWCLSTLVAISAAVVVPLLILAFNITTFRRLSGSAKAAIERRSTLALKHKSLPAEDVEAKPGTKPRKGPALPDHIHVRSSTSGGGRTALASLLLFLAILPVKEVRFPFTLAHRFFIRWFGSSGAPIGNISESPTASPAEATADSTTADSDRRWKLRPWAKGSLFVAISLVRVCFFPLWFSILSVEALVALLVCSVLELLFDVPPPGLISGFMKGFCMSTLSGPEDTVSKRSS